MPKEYLFLVRISMERSLAGPSRAERKAAQITGAIGWPVAGNSDGFGNAAIRGSGNTSPRALRCKCPARRHRA